MNILHQFYSNSLSAQNSGRATKRHFNVKKAAVDIIRLLALAPPLIDGANENQALKRLVSVMGLNSDSYVLSDAAAGVNSSGGRNKSWLKEYR